MMIIVSINDNKNIIIMKNNNYNDDNKYNNDSDNININNINNGYKNDNTDINITNKILPLPDTVIEAYWLRVRVETHQPIVDIAGDVLTKNSCTEVRVSSHLALYVLRCFADFELLFAIFFDLELADIERCHFAAILLVVAPRSPFTDLFNMAFCHYLIDWMLFMCLSVSSFGLSVHMIDIKQYNILCTSNKHQPNENCNDE